MGVDHTEVSCEGAIDGYEGHVGDGRLYPTVIESRGAGDDQEERCPFCGSWYSLIGSHWSQGSCSYPPISAYKMELLKGMMLGDGFLDLQSNFPRFEISNTNKSFLQWLSTELGWLTTSVRMEHTAEQSYKKSSKLPNNASLEGFHDLFRIRTKLHPQYQRFKSWYSTDEIVFPSDLSLSPESLRLWYVSDGSVKIDNRNSRSHRPALSSFNESERPQSVLSALRSLGFNTYQSSYHFCISVDDTEDFFEYIGEPIVGFEYKWEYEDYDEYKRLKATCKDEHYSQTFS